MVATELVEAAVIEAVEEEAVTEAVEDVEDEQTQ